MFRMQQITSFSLVFSGLIATASASADSQVAESKNHPRDVVYKYTATDITTGMDSTLSLDRATISVGSFVFDLNSCPSEKNLICIRSEYFSLVVPQNPAARWSDGQYEYVLLGEQALSFVGASEPTLVVGSMQRHSLFTFYLTSAGKLLGWTQISRAKGIPVSYLANPSPR